MRDKIKAGKAGENLAAEYLQKKGFTVVARNFRYGHKEIDLIVRRDNWMIFVEVKSRSSTSFGEPEDFVDGLKAHRIVSAAEHFIFETNWQGHIRFDIVSVSFGNPVRIDHFEDAFY